MTLALLGPPRKGHDFTKAPTSTEDGSPEAHYSRLTMHLLKALTAFLLPLVALGAKKPDKFQQFHTKALSSSPLHIDDSVYGHLTTAPRDYSVVVLLTALESRFGCQLCRDFQPEWELLAKSWIKGDKKGESRLIYATLDFADGKGTFQSVCSLTVLQTFQC